jgi:hypothetical protein
MVGRTLFMGDVLYSIGVSGFIYPVFGHWCWGPDGFLATMGSAGGFLSSLGMNFHDFAGSTVVHSIGGWVAIAGAIMLGPRLGRRFKRDGGGPMPPHDLTIAVIGGLILWFGWYGFNPGSTLSLMDNAGVGRRPNTTRCVHRRVRFFNSRHVFPLLNGTQRRSSMASCRPGGITAPVTVNSEGAMMIGKWQKLQIPGWELLVLQTMIRSEPDWFTASVGLGHHRDRLLASVEFSFAGSSPFGPKSFRAFFIFTGLLYGGVKVPSRNVSEAWLSVQRIRQRDGDVRVTQLHLVCALSHDGEGRTRR